MLPSQQALSSLSPLLRTTFVILWVLESNTCIWGLMTLSWVVDDFYEASRGPFLFWEARLQGINLRQVNFCLYSLLQNYFQKLLITQDLFLPKVQSHSPRLSSRNPLKKQKALYPILEDGALVCTKDLSVWICRVIFILELSWPMFYTGLHPEIHFSPASFRDGWTWWLPMTSYRLWQNDRVLPWKKWSWEKD